MTHQTQKISPIILIIIILFSIWQTPMVSANTIITPQPIFNTQQIPTQEQNTPNNKIIQKSSSKKAKPTKKSIKKNTKPSVKQNKPKSKTTKSKEVNTNKNTAHENVNQNSKTTSTKNWERYITPPIIIITLILVSIFKKP